MPGSISVGNRAPTLRVGDVNQHEFGISSSLLNARLTSSVAHCGIKQKNCAVPNSEHHTLVWQGVVPPVDYSTYTF